MTLTIDLNLQRVAMISIATSLWEASHVKQEIKDFFKNTKYEPAPRYQGWYIIARKVLQNLDSLALSKIISRDLEKIIVAIGEKIYDWTEYVMLKLSLPFSFAEKIYWTCYGTIDELKIFQLFWSKVDFPSSTTHSYFKVNTVYVLASANADENFLNDSIDDMTQQMKEIYPMVDVNNYKDKIYTFMSLWLHFDVTRCSSHPFRNVHFASSGHIIPPEIMLKLCAKQGFIYAVKYYYNKLSENLKCKIIEDLAVDCIHHSIFLLKDNNVNCNHDLVKSAQILIFLINQMEEEQRRSFLSHYITQLVRIFLPIWPFQELIKLLFNINWFERPDVKFEKLIGNNLSCIKHSYAADCPVKKVIYSDILYRVWEKIPKIEKIWLFTRTTSVINKIYEIFDIPFIKFVTSDPDVKSCRDLVIAGASKKCRKLVVEGQFDLIDQFMTNVLAENERESFVERLNFLEDLIMRDKFDVADQLLDWLSDRDGRKSRAQIKNEIDGIKICHELAEQGQCNLAEKFTKWQFETEDERKHFKTLLKSDETISRTIYRIWNDQSKKKNLKLVAQRCTDYLMFYFESEEEVVRFKKEKLNLLENEHFVEFLFTNVMKDHKIENFEIIDALFNFLLIPPEKIKQVKETMSSNIEWWIDAYGKDRGSLELADFLINWIYSEKDKKKEVIKNYVNSSKGVLLCNALIKRYTSFYSFPGLFRLASWLKLSENITRVKEELTAINDNVPVWFTFLISKLEEGNDVLSAIWATMYN